MNSTLIYYQRVPTDGARRLGCAGIIKMCCRLPASGLWRPEARWPDKVLFSAEKSRAASRQMPHGGRGGTAKVIFAGAKIGALRAMACGPGGGNGFGASGGAALRQAPPGGG